jgi:hypothetical protein
MDVTTMPSTSSLLPRLQADFSQWKFESGEHFTWSSNQQTIYFVDSGDPAYLLHEIAHALLGHSSYDRDIDLIKLERDAWDTAVHKLAPKYDIEIDSSLVQDNIDTYRDWLHARSLCPNCSSVGYQTKQSVYSCPVCSRTWRVNEARTCELRRYKIT